MATIVTRETGATAVNRALTNAELDNNFINLNTDIGNKQPLDADLTAIAALTGTTGLLKKTDADTWALDTSTYATQTYVGTQIANLVSSAPTTLDTLNELATALGNDANFSTTITTALGNKQPLDADLTAIAALSGTSGFLKKTAADTWALDTTTYLTAESDTFASVTGRGASTTSAITVNNTITSSDTIKATNGRIALRDDSIENWATASDSAGIAVNYYGYASGTSYFRDFSVFDGKGSLRFKTYGSDNYAYAPGSFRAPIFYDYNDTSYYLDPNSTSVLNFTRFKVSGYPIVDFKNTDSANYGLVEWTENGSHKAWMGMGGSNQSQGDNAAYAQDGFSINHDGGGAFTISNRGGSKWIRLSTGSEGSNGFHTLNIRDGNVIINQNAISYSSMDNTPLVGSATTNRLHVNGSIQLTGDNDALVIGRGTSSFFKDEELGFGWGGGWYMTDETYLRVRNGSSITLYTSGIMRADSSMRSTIFYDQNDTGYYLDPAGTSVSASLNGPIIMSNSAWTGEVPGKIQYHSNNWYFQYSSWFHFRNASSGNMFYGDSSGNTWSYASSRAPIFYDSDDTTYYLDPNSTGTSLKVAGNIDLYARSAGWAEGIRIRVPSTGNWGGIRWTRDRGNDDGNWALGYTALDSTDDFILWANNSGDGGSVKFRITKAGTMTLNGAFNATSKSFLIDHPTKPGMKLRYGSLEGPENGVYIRGKQRGNRIELPDYWIKLVDPDSITVTLTPVGKHQKLYVDKIENNAVYVGNDGLFSGEAHYFYVVYAERVDVEKLGVEIPA